MIIYAYFVTLIIWYTQFKCQHRKEGTLCEDIWDHQACKRFKEQGMCDGWMANDGMRDMTIFCKSTCDLCGTLVLILMRTVHGFNIFKATYIVITWSTFKCNYQAYPCITVSFDINWELYAEDNTCHEESILIDDARSLKSCGESCKGKASMFSFGIGVGRNWCYCHTGATEHGTCTVIDSPNEGCIKSGYEEKECYNLYRYLNEGV